MVHKYLVSRGLARILFGFVLVLLGFVVFINLMTQPITSRFPLPEQVVALLLEAKARQGAIIGAIGIIFLIFGTVYFLATVILEYRKKRRYAHRSNTYE